MRQEEEKGGDSGEEEESKWERIRWEGRGETGIKIILMYLM